MLLLKPGGFGDMNWLFPVLDQYTRSDDSAQDEAALRPKPEALWVGGRGNIGKLDRGEVFQMLDFDGFCIRGPSGEKKLGRG